MLDIKKLREKQNKAGFGRLYKNENGLAAWTYEGMRPVVAAQSKNLNNALAHIDYIVAAANALPEALDEIERLREALKLACTKFAEHMGTCPHDLCDWACPGDCDSQCDVCWEAYFESQAGGGVSG